MRIGFKKDCEIEILGKVKVLKKGRVMRAMPRRAMEIHEQHPNATILITSDEWRSGSGKIKRSLLEEEEE